MQVVEFSETYSMCIVEDLLPILQEHLWHVCHVSLQRKDGILVDTYWLMQTVESSEMGIRVRGYAFLIGSSVLPLDVILPITQEQVDCLATENELVGIRGIGQVGL